MTPLQRTGIYLVNKKNFKRHPNKLWYVADVNLVAFHRNHIHRLADFFLLAGNSGILQCLRLLKNDAGLIAGMK
jgi:hypothetical protein